MRMFCAWCNRVLSGNKCEGDEIPKDQQVGTYGICTECVAKHFGEIVEDRKLS